MKNIFFCLLLMLSAAMTGVAQEPAFTLRVSPQIEMNQDSIGFAITPDGVGLISNSAKVVIFKTSDGGEAAVIGNLEDPSVVKGIYVAGDGARVVINASEIIIVRKEFTSHAEADLQLQKNEEYFLQGDRLVYRKP
jgi:hypothetical protein